MNITFCRTIRDRRSHWRCLRPENIKWFYFCFGTFFHHPAVSRRREFSVWPPLINPVRCIPPLTILNQSNHLSVRFTRSRNHFSELSIINELSRNIHQCDRFEFIPIQSDLRNEPLFATKSNESFKIRSASRADLKFNLRPIVLQRIFAWKIPRHRMPA